MAAAAGSRMKRPIYAMPEYVKDALRTNDVEDAYRERPKYQQNDYVGWITRAKMQATRQRRIDQMVSELKSGKLYMNMKYTAPTKTDA